MAMQVVLGILGAVEVGTNLAGVPFVGGAATILEQIITTCDKLRIHKKKARHIRHKCALLNNTFSDLQSREHHDPELRRAMDESIAVLEAIYNRMVKWSRLSAWSLIVKMSDIAEGLDKCELEIDTALQKFNVVAHAVGQRLQIEAMQETRLQQEVLQELLIQALTQPNETSQIIAMQRTGSHIAEQLMQAGQEQLRSKQNDDVMMSDSSTDGGSSGAPIPSPSKDAMRDALFKFHTVTGTLPQIKRLNDEITKVGEMAVAGSTYSDIWVGLWLGQKKVALKGLRNIKIDDPRANMRIEREILTWASLDDKHILPFWGVVTNIGTHVHMVSPWQENGNVLEYLRRHPSADRMSLIKGAAQGLAYLHSKKIVHGNVKCTNILVLDNGDACICDFGMSKLIEEVTERAASATLTAAGSARWLAPELIDGTISSPTFSTDIYSFAMAVLELLTGKYPFAERKRDASVIHDVVVRKQTPARPKADVCIWLTNDLWKLLQGCWHNSPSLRPSMAEVTAVLEVVA